MVIGHESSGECLSKITPSAVLQHVISYSLCADGLRLVLRCLAGPPGTVVEVGPGVTSLQPGDDVALEPGIPCWFNRASREGRYNIDPDIKFFATPPVHGSLAEVAHLACPHTRLRLCGASGALLHGCARLRNSACSWRPGYRPTLLTCPYRHV